MSTITAKLTPRTTDNRIDYAIRASQEPTKWVYRGPDGRYLDGAYGNVARRQSMHGRGNLLTVACVLGVVGVWAVIVYLAKQ